MGSQPRAEATQLRGCRQRLADTRTAASRDTRRCVGTRTAASRDAQRCVGTRKPTSCKESDLISGPKRYKR